jgi:predicted ester cyclase
MAFYRRYLQRCNEHRFDELGEFVANDVNGPIVGLSRYIAGLHAVVKAFPDYHWELQRLLVDDQWLAARLSGTGTHTGLFRGIAATGPVIRIGLSTGLRHQGTSYKQLRVGASRLTMSAAVA